MLKQHRIVFPASKDETSVVNTQPSEQGDRKEQNQRVHCQAQVNIGKRSYAAEHLLSIVVCLWIPKASTPHPTGMQAFCAYTEKKHTAKLSG